MEVVPRNTKERAYNVAVIIFGVLMFSSVISSVTNAMTELRERNAKRARQQEQLTEFFQNQSISTGLSNHIHAVLKHRGYAEGKRIVESELSLLHGLPEKLRMRMHNEMYRPALLVHPLFMLLH